jgi:hypothetical protein
MAKGKKTGGRKPGSVNKATIAREEEIAATGEMPRDYMLRIMRDKTVGSDRRDRMAAAVAARWCDILRRGGTRAALYFRRGGERSGLSPHEHSG